MNNVAGQKAPAASRINENRYKKWCGMPFVSVVFSMFPLPKKGKTINFFLWTRTFVALCISVAVIIVSIGIIYPNYGRLKIFANLYSVHSNLKRTEGKFNIVLSYMICEMISLFSDITPVSIVTQWENMLYRSRTYMCMNLAADLLSLSFDTALWYT